MNKQKTQLGLNRFFKDSRGKTVIYQPPNAPIIIWFIATVTAKLFSSGNLHEFFSLIAFGAIFLWAYLEITQGATYFRRTIGTIVLILTFYSRLT